ncbi:spore germination protein [Alicyclobacillus contaminans]|uniref:spore germination protein n=1 Tax=Alicyclobacillus contaminans TaxID=392016 RepID=UPI00047AD33F|nr:spore germination protein [Alicyclobacillus contaminans]GMA50221.1 spore germination protein [Alicyclobacillus contaminans]
MQIPGWLRRLVVVDDGVLDEQFSLTNGTNRSNRSEGGAQGATETGGQPDEPEVTAREPGEVVVRRPKPVRELIREAERGRSVPVTGDKLPADIDEAQAMLKHIFHLPQNKDIVIREFFIGTEPRIKALAVFVDGMSDKNIINTHILEPLMILTQLGHEQASHTMDTVKAALLPGNQVVEFDCWKDVTAGILTGSTVVFVDGCASALMVETKGWEHRMVGLTQTEAVVRGPHDAFTESFRANTALVRARLRSENLVTEMLSVGRLAKTDVAIMYVAGLTNEQLVQEVKRRIQAIDVDYLAESGLLEQFIADNPYMVVPQSLSTERPDRIAHMLSEGHVAIFVGNNPYVLAVPVVFWTLMHSPEDAYLQWPFGTFLRGLRWVSLLVALLMPALYVAITNFHPEMLPTDLLLAIAGSREQVPFPVILEVMLMEFAIELIREAGIRIPSAIGPTIGIVGALIIGQAAVQAGIVSPLLVIVVAVTALASFSIPNYTLGFGVRLLRFVFLIAAAMFGFYGITLTFCLMLARLAVQRSFGVPIFAPVTPSMGASPDVLRRGQAFMMNKRPSYLQTRDTRRQQKYTRTWSATSPRNQDNRNDGGDA